MDDHHEGSRDTLDRVDACIAGYARLNALEEFGTGPNVMDLLLFSVIALQVRLREAILVSCLGPQRH